MTDNEQPKRPQYGELAPEGWVSPVTGEPVTPESALGAPATQTTSPTPTKLNGVPHNLGVKTEGDGAASTGAAQTSTAQDSTGNPPAVPAAAASASEKPQPRRDRVVTILLIVFGAFGAYNLSDSFLHLSELGAQVYEMYDAGTFAAPEWLGTVSTIAVITTLSLWTLSTIVSIQLMQRGKLSFYVPLIAAALAWIMMTVILYMAMPELIAVLVQRAQEAQ